MRVAKRLPALLTVRKPVRLGARTYLSGSEVRWRNLGLQERKADQLVRLGYFEDPFKRGAVPVEREGTAELQALSMAQLRELLPEGAKARSKKDAVQLILEARVAESELGPEE